MSETIKIVVHVTTKVNTEFYQNKQSTWRLRNMAECNAHVFTIRSEGFAIFGALILDTYLLVGEFGVPFNLKDRLPGYRVS